MDFRKTETNLFFAFVRAEEGSGEESARAFEFLAGFVRILFPLDRDFLFAKLYIVAKLSNYVLWTEKPNSKCIGFMLNTARL